MQAFRLLLALGAAAALLVGCGSGSDPDRAEKEPWLFQSLHLTLDGEAGPETAGLLTAQKLGYFEDRGLGLTITPPLNPERPVQYVAAGSVDVAVTHEPEVVLAQAQGRPIVAVGSLVPRPTMAMIWLQRSGMSDLADLRGKTIAMPGAPFQRRFLQAVLARVGLTLGDVELIEKERDLVSQLADGRADAIFGGSPNVEGAALESRGLKTTAIPAAELGIPPYDELVVIAREDRVAENPELFRRLMAAVRQGTAAAIEDPATAVEAIDEGAYGESERRPTEAGVEATLPLLSRSGQLSSGQATGLIAWMHDEGMIERKPPAAALIGP